MPLRTRTGRAAAAPSPFAHGGGRSTRGGAPLSLLAMWPGQQPPGGEQNPQDQNQNPYQQPGYQQPNPYQQPGYQQQGQQPNQQPGQQPGYGYPQQGGQGGYGQPNPYQQPTVPQYAVPGPPGDPQPGNDKKKTTVIAIVAATAVVV